MVIFKSAHPLFGGLIVLSLTACGGGSTSTTSENRSLVDDRLATSIPTAVPTNIQSAIPTPTATKAPVATKTATPTRTPTPINTTAPTSTVTASALTCSVTKKGEWPNHYQFDVTIANTSTSSINDWQVVLSFPETVKKVGGWNANFNFTPAVNSMPADSSLFTDITLSSQKALGANQSVSPGIQINYPSGTRVIPDCNIVGQVKYLPPTQPAENSSASAECRGMNYGPRQLKLLTKKEYQNTVRDLFGVDDVTIIDVSKQLLDDSVEFNFINQTKTMVSDSRVDAFYTAADKVVSFLNKNKYSVVGCNLSSDLSTASIGYDACIDQFLNVFASKVIRRELLVAEKAVYRNLFNVSLTGGNIGEGLKLGTLALLMSPEFLYRSELGDAVGAYEANFSSESYRLTPYEMASFISYTLLGTTPDDLLLSAAKNNQLNTESQLSEQANRLLMRPQAVNNLGDFVVQWLGTGSILILPKDATLFPSFTPELARDFDQEIRLTYAKTVMNNGTIADLFNSDQVFVNNRLASFYKLNPVAGSNFVSAPANDHRGGLLTTGAFLASYAHAEETAPFARAKAIRERLLCQTLPMLPPNINVSRDEAQAGAQIDLSVVTSRDKFSYLTKAAACQACHKDMLNPLGFGLEDFDAAGQHRTLDKGNPVNSSGALTGINSLFDGQSVLFNGGKQLGQQLARLNEVSSCFVDNANAMITGINQATTNANELLANQCISEELKADLANNDYKLQSMYKKMILLDAIRYRK